MGERGRHPARPLRNILICRDRERDQPHLVTGGAVALAGLRTKPKPVNWNKKNRPVLTERLQLIEVDDVQRLLPAGPFRCRTTAATRNIAGRIARIVAGSVCYIAQGQKS